MKLYIQIKNGKPHEHPITDWNLREAFPEVDLNNLPPTFAPFERVHKPKLGVYETEATVTYGLKEGAAGTYTDIWTVTPMTSEEIAAKQQSVKDEFAVDHPTYVSWTFDETTCSMVPPVAYPENDDQSPDSVQKRYTWNEEDQTWDVLPNPPFDVEEES
jgi:hypothetical protein